MPLTYSRSVATFLTCSSSRGECALVGAVHPRSRCDRFSVLPGVLEAPGGPVIDAYVTSNVIENLPSAGGIFVGTDGERTPGDVCERIVIRDNVIRGTFHGLINSDWKCDGSNAPVGASIPFIINVPKHARDWFVENNIVDNTS